jgi:hypothetical protein
MVSGKQWLRDAEEHVGRLLLAHDLSTCVEPLDGISDLFQYPLGEKIRAGRIVALVKTCARLWMTSVAFTTLVKRDLMLFEFLAWGMRLHQKAMQGTIGMRHYAALERWIDFRATLNANRGASRAPATDGVEAVDGDDSAVDGEDEDFAANEFVANFLQKPPDLPPPAPTRMKPKRLVPTPPAFPPTPPTPYGPKKRLPHLAKWHGAVPPTTASESSTAHMDTSMHIPLGTLPSVPLGNFPLVSESEVLLREQNAYLRGLLATAHRFDPYG